MPRLLFFLLIASASIFGAVDVSKPISSISLRDGRVLKDVQIVSFASTAIMAKWEGGRGTISYDLLPAEITDAIAPLRPKQQQAISPQTIATDGRKLKIEGQIFVPNHEGGAYRFVDTEVTAYPFSEMAKVLAQQKRSARDASPNVLSDPQVAAFWKALKNLHPLGSARSDAEGKFKLEIPQEIPAFIFCVGIYRVDGYPIPRIWIVPAPKDINLTADNTWHPY